MAQTEEKALILEAQSGNTSAFRELVFRYDRKILAMSMGLAVSEQDARRLYRETMLSLTFALGVSFPAVRGRIRNVVNTGSGEKAWVKTLPLV